MRLGAKKPDNVETAAEPNVGQPEPNAETATPAGPAPERSERAKHERPPLKILFGETISADGQVTATHEAELAKIVERAAGTNGKDPRFSQKQFADWHGWCHWRAAFARVQAAHHQTEADRWEARKKGRDLDKELSLKAKIEREVKRINAHRAKLGKAPLTAEQAAVVLS